MSRREGGYLEHVKSLLHLGGKAETVGGAVQRPVKGQLRSAPGGQVAREAASLDDARQAFETDLKAFAVQRDPSDPLVAGKVHLINLNKVRERMGEKWPRYADRVHGHIKAELKQRLTQHDYFTQVNANTYAVVFGDCSAVEARLKMALLCEQILARLFGEGEAKDLNLLGVETLVTQADGSVAAEALESVDSLIELLDHAEVAHLDPGTHRYQAAAAGDRALTPREVSELLGEVDDHIKALDASASGGAPPEIRVDRLRALVRQLESLEEVVAARNPPATPKPTHKEKIDPCGWAEIRKPTMEAIHQIKCRAERQITLVYEQEPASYENSPGDESALNIEFSYVPMWHAPTQKVGIYLCQASLEEPVGDARQVSSDGAQIEAEILAIIDRLTLRQARQELQTSLEGKNPNLIAVPIHFSTLRRHGSQQRIVELCSNIPEELRKLLVWELRGADVDGWGSQLAKATEAIRKFGRAIFLRLDEPQDHYHEIRRNLRYLRPAAVREIGLDVRDLQGPESVRFAFLERLAADAAVDNLKYYGHGFDTLSLAICAIRLGYQQVSGPAIAAPMAHPAGIQVTTLEEIYRHGSA